MRPRGPCSIDRGDGWLTSRSCAVAEPPARVKGRKGSAAAGAGKEQRSPLPPPPKAGRQAKQQQQQKEKKKKKEQKPKNRLGQRARRALAERQYGAKASDWGEEGFRTAERQKGQQSTAAGAPIPPGTTSPQWRWHLRGFTLL